MERGSIAQPTHGNNIKQGNHKKEQLVRLEDENMPLLHEWRFNLRTGVIKCSQIDDSPNDFPRLNDRLMGFRNRYGYTANLHVDRRTGTPHFAGVTKYDLDTKLSASHIYGSNRYGGEAVFVPNVTSTASNINRSTTVESEDDGWLLNYVFDTETGTSELVVLDAKTMDDEPVARVILPRRVPYGFHGTWIPQDFST